MPQVTPAMMRQLSWSVSYFQTFARLMVYCTAAVRWSAEIAWDKLRRRDCLERRAVRLRVAIEKIGGTAVKLGQQMAMRIDLLPYEYSVELSKMMDRMPVFPTAYAIERIEKCLGKRLLDVFAAFDPEPIGSASMACVFQAFLKNGERVAIKVRRPALERNSLPIAMPWPRCFKCSEFLTIIRPGLSRNFVYEFRSMLMEELDFTKEARYTELFRNGVRKHLKNVSAPRIYYDLSTTDVLVTEFVSGVWMRELIAAVDEQDRNHIGDSPQGGHSSRAGGEPAFTRQPVRGLRERPLSCRSASLQRRYSAQQQAGLHRFRVVRRLYHQRTKQLEATVLLPRSGRHRPHGSGGFGDSGASASIDIDEFGKRVEDIFWQDLYAFRSKHAQWWERTSAKIWIRFLQLAREYQVPLNLNTLKMIRSTLLYETIAARFTLRWMPIMSIAFTTKRLESALANASTTRCISGSSKDRPAKPT